MPTPVLSIVVLTYNGDHLLPDCLASIEAQEIPVSHEKLILDNGSATPAPWRKGWITRRLAPNVGHIQGQNECFHYAMGEWVLFVSNDVRLEPNCIQELIILTEKYQLSQMMPTILWPNGETQSTGLCNIWPGYWGNRTSEWLKVSAIPSIIYLMKKSAWQQVGGFDTGLVRSHEDADMGMQLRRAHHKVGHLIPARAIHLANQTLKHQPGNVKAAFHADRLYVVNKHYKGLSRLIRVGAIRVLDGLAKWRR